MIDQHSSLISASELAAAIPPVGSGQLGPLVLDVRWQLGRTDGHEQYLSGHIPGAVYVDLDVDLAAVGREASEGRHPLPDIADFEASVRRWGLRDGGSIVVYDDAGGMSAARAWWLLRHAGVGSVRVLDGGLGAWGAAGHPLDTGDVSPAPGDVRLAYGAMPVLDIDQAAALPDRGLLLDARAGERFRGEVEPIDPKAGHVPGAVSVPTADNLDSDRRFLSPDALRARFADAGVGTESEVGVYCGSGVTAAHEVLALELAGIRAALYPGSWSAWSNTPTRPVAVGP